MTIEKAILQALQKGVIAAVAASIKDDLPVKYMGRTFTKPDDNCWLEVVHIPNNITDEFWATEKTYRGIFRLILHWGIDDKGAYEPMQVIESVGSYFAKGTKLVDPGNTVRVSITDNPNLLSVIEEAPEMLLPLSIRYQFFKA
jgi:hypothetical protein